jgi:predicted nucleotidyltransferase
MSGRQVIERLSVDATALDDFCRRWQVAELAAFGSILGDRFGADSDVDLLVSFRPEARWTLWDFLRLREELADLLGREVDVIERVVVEHSRNYLRRKAILESAQVIYAA